MAWRIGFALLTALSWASANELTAPAIVKTIRYHPPGTPAQVGMRVLSRSGERGWTALAALVAQYRDEHPEVAMRAATALAEGPEAERLAIVASAYNRNTNPELRAVFAVGLAYGFEDHKKILLRHMRENRQGAADVLRILAPRKLDQGELRRLLGIPDLAPISYDALRARRLRIKARELLPWAREIGRACLDREACGIWTGRGDYLIYEAIALATGDKDEDVRDGAHCLLLTLSGKKLASDPLVWRSWITAHRDQPASDDALSPGALAAAIVRGARYLRVDLLEDGRARWAPDHDDAWAAGTTSLAILALRAAGYPRSHPAIKKAVETSLIQLGPRGQVAMPPFRSRNRETYNLALLAMALCELDPARYKVILEALHKRLVTGMHENGMWGYQCIRSTDTMKRGGTDNSVTQYAVLALRSLQRAGFKTDRAIWYAIAKNLHATVNGHGGWNYHARSGGHQISMSAAGISSLAIAYEGADRKRSAQVIQNDKVLTRARKYVGRMLMESDYGHSDLYVYYGVERAFMLTATREMRSKNRVYDWYRRGAARLLGKQDRTGHWGWYHPHVSTGASYGKAIDTSYAILFLTKATRTIGSSKSAPLAIDLAAKYDKPDPPPAKPEPSPEPPPRPPELVFERPAVTTLDGNATIRGSAPTPQTRLTLDGKEVPLDARGRFELPVTISGKKLYAFVAMGANGISVTREVEVRFDKEFPRVELLGSRTRHVGKQVLIFRATEPLRSLQIAGRVFPADGPIVRAAFEVPEGERTLLVLATDFAGNQSRNEVVVAATNRVLVCDGISAVGVDLRWKTRIFTAECWVRGDVPSRPMAVVADTEASGFGLFWSTQGHPLPYGLARAGGNYLAVNPKKKWDWSRWTHLAISYDGKLLRYFVNGKLQGSAEGTPHHPSARRLFIGAQPNRHNVPEQLFVGAIDEVRISTLARYEKDFRPARTFMRDRHTLLLMHFDRPTVVDGVLLDDSGTHHHMTPYGAPEQVAEKRP